MEKTKLDYHPSSVIALRKETGEVLMGVYTEGYHSKIYIGSANLLGGNPTKEDKSPLEVLTREINEEFANPPANRGNIWTKAQNIKEIRMALQHNQPYADFFFEITKMGGVKHTPCRGICSVFISYIPQEIFEKIRISILNGEKIMSEGAAGIFSINDLIKGGIYSTAIVTPPILSEYFGVEIPKPDEVTAVRMVTPVRDSFRDYMEEFEYAGTTRFVQ